MRKWEQLFKPHILERGYDYYIDDAVDIVTKNGNTYMATVHGTEPYHVEIKMQNDTVKEMYCDCPYAQDMNNCKHMAAMLYEIEAIKQTEKDNEIANLKADFLIAINNKRKDELIDIMLKYADESFMLNALSETSEKAANFLSQKYEAEFDAIVERYSYEDGYIDYNHAYDFCDDMEGFLDDVLFSLTNKEQYMKAFDFVLYCVREFDLLQIDDSDGELSVIINILVDYLEDIIENGNNEEKERMHRTLKDYIYSNHYSVFYDMMEEIFVSEFDNNEHLEKALEYVDKQLDSTEYEWEFEDLLIKRLNIMERLEKSDEEIQAFIDKHRQYSNVRMYEINKHLNKSDYNSAITLLKESITIERADLSYRANGFALQLLDIYRKIENHSEYKSELKDFIFIHNQHNLEYINEYKALCSKTEWSQVLSKLLKSNSVDSCKLELLNQEKLYKELFNEIVHRGDIQLLDKYEKVLRKEFSLKIIEIYENYIRGAMNIANDRNQYRNVIKYLNTISTYPDGESISKSIAKEWKIKYSRRKAMLDELKKAGY